MKTILVSILVLMSLVAQAETKLKFNYENGEITKIIDDYAKATGQQFIIDPVVKGKITILNPQELTAEEAFNQLSYSLAINGFAIIKQGNLMTVRSARSAQRDGIEVLTQLAPLKPERMVTYMITLKNVSVDEINKDMRMLASKDGELSIFKKTNQLVITDWISNVSRVSELLKQLDKPLAPDVAKIVERSEKQRMKARQENNPDEFQEHSQKAQAKTKGHAD